MARIYYTTTSIAVIAAAAASVALPIPAFGQAVSDRTLSDVKVEQFGSCKLVTIDFNIRIQMLSFFPQTGGREAHVRIRPLDAAQANSARESLRTPASVPELRSIEYEGDNPAGPVLSLFFTRDMRFEVAAGNQPQSLVIRLDQPGSGPICAAPQSGADANAPATQMGPAGLTTGLRPDIAIPSGLYAINVVSRPGDVSALSATQRALISGKITYETQFERDSQHWRRLRIGFFETRAAADAAKAELAKEFPEAWVVKITADEREHGVATRMDSGIPAVAFGATPQTTASETDKADAIKLIGDAEEAIKTGDNDRAVQLLSNALLKPENESTPRALELLGLTRERKGQMAHATAEYEEYLRRYPSGEAADRVSQRLAAIKSASTGPASGELRAASGGARSATAWTWGARGSLSQFYFRDQTKTTLIDASRPPTDPADINNAVNLNQLLSSADLTISGGNDRHQLQLRAAGSFTKDFRPTGHDVKALSAFYLDYANRGAGFSARIGRQTRNSAGVLGRFDGALVGLQVNPKLRFNVVGGFPVLSSRQTYILRDRFFYGASVDLGGRRDTLQTSFYWFDQRAQGGFVDRRSVGFEGRYLKSRFNAFTIIDYDVKYKQLNLGLLTLNYTFPDTSNISVTADYRQQPLLTTQNALTGQVDPNTFEPITSLRGLRPFFTDPQIYQLAKDRTLPAYGCLAESRVIQPATICTWRWACFFRSSR